MALFFSTYTNKVDKKGRVSVPAQFRAEISQESFKGVILFKSNEHQCIEGLARSSMQELADRIDNFDLFSSRQDDIATTIFGNSVQLPFDGDGRIILPSDMVEFAGITDKASFVGLGGRFQIWSPDLLEIRKKTARENVKSEGMNIPKAPASDGVGGK